MCSLPCHCTKHVLDDVGDDAVQEDAQMLEDLILSLPFPETDEPKCSTVLRGMYCLSSSGALNRYHLHTVLCTWAVPVSAFLCVPSLAL